MVKYAENMNAAKTIFNVVYWKNNLQFFLAAPHCPIGRYVYRDKRQRYLYGGMQAIPWPKGWGRAFWAKHFLIKARCSGPIISGCADFEDQEIRSAIYY